jgi:aromatic ring-opening dioxygenase LigB subunit
MFLMGWLLVFGLKECLVECATVCVKSVVILTGILEEKQMKIGSSFYYYKNAKIHV